MGYNFNVNTSRGRLDDSHVTYASLGPEARGGYLVTAAPSGHQVGVSPLRQRAFRVYWIGGFVSNIGTWLQNVTASVLILQLTGSPLMVGVLNVANFAPIFAFSMLGGMLSDRFGRRTVVVCTQVFSLLISAMTTLLSAAGQLTAPRLIGLVALLGCSYALAKPALAALLPDLVARPELPRATAMNTLQFNLGQVVGSALSALVLAVTGVTTAFTLNTLSFLAPIVAMYLLRAVQLTGKSTARLRGSGLAGVRFALHTPAVSSMLLAVCLSNAAVEALRTLAPEFTDQALRLSASSTGILITVYGLGSTAVLLLFGPISSRLGPRRTLTVAFLLQGGGLLGVATSQHFLVSCLLAALIGAGFSLNIPVLSAGLQMLSPDEFRGRVMSLFSMTHLGLRPLFSLTAGVLGTVVNVRLALGLFVVFPLLAIGLAGLNRRQTAEPARTT